MVVDGGKCGSISQVAKFLELDKPTVGSICKEIQDIGHIKLSLVGNKKEVEFSDNVVEEGLKTVYAIIGK